MHFIEDQPSAPRDSSWHALYTRYQHEKSVARMLCSNGFKVFLPLRPMTRRWKDRFKKLELPLFPSYVFVQGGLERHVDVLSTPGVCWFVETAGRPAAIPENEMDTIKRIVEHRLCAEPHPFLKCGDYVRVRSGPLQDVEGILIRKKDHGARLVVSVELLQRAVAVDVDALTVERLSRVPLGIPVNRPPAFRLPEPKQPASLPIALSEIRRSPCQS